VKSQVARNLVIVGVAYACASFVLYRARVLSDNPGWDSDALVLYSPALIALVANGFVLWRAFRGRLTGAPRLGAAIGLAVVATFAAASCWALIAVNLYST